VEGRKEGREGEREGGREEKEGLLVLILTMTDAVVQSADSCLRIVRTWLDLGFFLVWYLANMQDLDL
jgi:hypothetical protein